MYRIKSLNRKIQIYYYLFLNYFPTVFDQTNMYSIHTINSYFGKKQKYIFITKVGSSFIGYVIRVKCSKKVDRILSFDILLSFKTREWFNNRKVFSVISLFWGNGLWRCSEIILLCFYSMNSKYNEYHNTKKKTVSLSYHHAFYPRKVGRGALYKSTI